jgi:hypothetical protein
MAADERRRPDRAIGEPREEQAEDAATRIPQERACAKHLLLLLPANAATSGNAGRGAVLQRNKMASSRLAGPRTDA